MTKLHRGTWIVAACHEGALILENAGAAQEPDLRLIDRLEAPAAHPLPTGQSHPEVTDRESLDLSAGAARVVGRLAREVARGNARHLVLAAAPPLLTAIRDRMDDDLRARLMLTLPQTLTRHPVPRIAAEVQTALSRAA